MAKLNVESWASHVSCHTLCMHLDSASQIIFWREQERLAGVALSSSLNVSAVAGLLPLNLYSLKLIHQLNEQFVQLSLTLSCSGLAGNG